MIRNISIVVVVLLALAALWFWVIRVPPPDEVLTKVMLGVERLEEADVDLFFDHSTQRFRDKLPIPEDRAQCKLERQKLKSHVFSNGGKFRVSFTDPIVAQADRRQASVDAVIGIEFDDAGALGGLNFKREWPVRIQMVFVDQVWKIDDMESPEFESWLEGQDWRGY